MKTIWVLGLFVLSAVGCSHGLVLPPGNPELSAAKETRITNLRQLTDGGTNAEAYWSFDGKLLSYQAKTDLQAGCDQIFTLELPGKKIVNLSKNRGRTTCAFFLPNDQRVLWSSTVSAGNACPVEPDRSQGYVWPIYHSFQMYTTKRDGSDLIPMEPGAPSAYNAEATVCKDGSVVFTSDRDGDLELYTAKLNSFGTIDNVKRITFTPGYDGGAFFSPDCTQLVWRASRPKPGVELNDYKKLLKQHLVRPSHLEIWVADREGANARQVTALGVASFAPYFTPDQKHVIFSSNKKDPKGGHGFDLWMVRTDGSALEQVTFSNSFDSFPMFSPDGKYLAFSSNRFAKIPRETNVFVGDWNGLPEAEPSIYSTYAPDRAAALTKKLSKALDQKSFEEEVATQFESIGLTLWMKDLTGLNRYLVPTKDLQKHNVIGVAGKDCGKKSAVLIATRLSPGSVDAITALLEAARKSVETQQTGCVVYAAYSDAELELSTLTKRNKDYDGVARIAAVIELDKVGHLEKNSITLAGPESATTWTQHIAPVCELNDLTCLKTPVKEGRVPRFVLTTTGQVLFNATGITQVAKFASDLATRIAQGKKNH